MSTIFSQNDCIEIGNDVVKLFCEVPVIRFESSSFLGLLGEVGLIVSGSGLSGWSGGFCNFLHEREQSFLQTINAANYKQSCFAGRLLAKSAWLLVNGSKRDSKNKNNLSPRPSFDQLCIISRDQFNRSTVPILFFGGIVVDYSFSISHIDSHVAVFFAKDNDLRIGCDLVKPNSITANLQQMFYKPDELDSQLNSAEKSSIQFHNERVWSVKETAFKILGNGRTFKPEQWLTAYSGNGWYQCTDTAAPDQKKINIRTQITQNKILSIGVSRKQ
jgi:hypothetical protein